MQPILKAFIAGIRASLDGIRPLFSAWRAWRQDGLGAASRTFLEDFKRHWPDSLFSVLTVITLLVLCTALGLAAIGWGWTLVRP